MIVQSASVLAVDDVVVAVYVGVPWLVVAVE